MALRKLLSRLSTPVYELDRETLRTYCSGLAGVTPIASAVPRQELRVVGEISALRIVPRADCPWLEAVITDGSGSLAVAWTGRRTIGGIAPGRRLVISGRGLPKGPKGRLFVLNPRYELL